MTEPSSAPVPPLSLVRAPADEAAVSRALDEVLARFTAAARRVAARAGLDRDDLDDLLQDVRIRLWRSLGTPEKIREARALYIHRAVASATLDLIRRRRTRREESLADFGDERGPTAPTRADAALDEGEFDAALARALDQLPLARRTVVRLHLAGHDRQEIADMLGWSEPKTRNLLYRGLADLRTALERAGLAPGGRS